MDGSFSSRAQVSHTTEEVAWTDGGAEYAGTAYTVTVEDPDLEQAAYTVHCRLPDPGKRYDLWVLSEDGWTKTDARLDGQYLLLESQTGTVTFCLTERAGPLAVVILAVGFAGLLIDHTESHRKLLQEHGWTKYFDVDLMDAEGPDVVWPIPNGKVLKENHVGKHILHYDSMLVLAHFKGHPMGGYGGALKQLAIGCASRAGKALIDQLFS